MIDFFMEYVIPVFLFVMLLFVLFLMTCVVLDMTGLATVFEETCRVVK